MQFLSFFNQMAVFIQYEPINFCREKWNRISNVEMKKHDNGNFTTIGDLNTTLLWPVCQVLTC